MNCAAVLDDLDDSPGGMRGILTSITASCRLGSKRSPIAAMRSTPKRLKTLRRTRSVASTPSISACSAGVTEPNPCNRRDRALQVVDHREQLAGEIRNGISTGLIDRTVGTPAHVFGFSERAQQPVAQACIFCNDRSGIGPRFKQTAFDCLVLRFALRHLAPSCMHRPFMHRRLVWSGCPHFQAR